MSTKRHPPSCRGVSEAFFHSLRSSPPIDDEAQVGITYPAVKGFHDNVGSGSVGRGFSDDLGGDRAT